MKKQNQKKQKSGNQQVKQIKGFEGYYFFLNNDYPTWVLFEGTLYPSVTTAYQAARSDDSSIREKIAGVSDVKEFSELVMGIKNPHDWNERKYGIMLNLVRDKFKRNKQVAQKLLSTKDKQLINVLPQNGFNEQYWGFFQGSGRNNLGKIIMKVREEFINNKDSKMWVQSLKLQKDSKLYPNVSLIVEKDSKKVDKLFLEKKNNYIFGSLASAVDFHLENPTISRFHACIYFSPDLQVILTDLNSTHGTFINKTKISPLMAYKLNNSNIISFGTSARTYTISIDYTDIEKDLKESDQALRIQIEKRDKQRKKIGEFDNLKREDARRLLGVQDKCLFIQSKQKQSDESIRSIFSQFGKIKKIRKPLNRTTGREDGSAIVYFEGSKQIEQITKKSHLLDSSIQIKILSQTEAQKILKREESVDRKKTSDRQRSRDDRKMY